MNGLKSSKIFNEIVPNSSEEEFFPLIFEL